VLDVQQGKSLFLSKYGLDVKPYNNHIAKITWENCSLRDWLNNDFLKTAFIDEEQSAVLTTKVDNSKDQGAYLNSDIDGGNNTQDQIFLLSYHEAFDLYLKSDSAWQCVPTNYAEAQGAYISSSHKIGDQNTGWWWLRSPGGNRNRGALLLDYGGPGNYYVDHGNVCVRPALWINLESDLF